MPGVEVSTERVSHRYRTQENGAGIPEVTIMRKIILSAAILTLAGLATSQATNQKVIHNTQHTDVAARNGANAQTIWYMQPKEARRGYGKFRGWVCALMDVDSGTAEKVDFGLSKYVAGKMEPDITASGRVFWTQASLNFKDPKNPTQKVQNLLWTITLQKAQPTPESFGLFVHFGAAKSSGTPPVATDGVFVHTQGGASSKLATALRKDWAWYMDSTMTMVAAHLWGKGTTLHLGGFYDEPVLRQFVSSTRYNPSKPAEDLYGLEAYWPDSQAKDAIGWDVESDQFINGLAVTTLGAALLPKSISTNMGTFWMSPPFGVIQAPAVFLGAKGTYKTPTPVPSIKGIQLYSQTAFINPKTFKIRMSDLTKIDIQ